MAIASSLCFKIHASTNENFEHSYSLLKMFLSCKTSMNMDGIEKRKPLKHDCICTILKITDLEKGFQALDYN